MSPPDPVSARLWPIPGRIRLLRTALGLTQQQLATTADVSLSCAYDLEHGRCAASPRSQRNLAAALGAELDDLFAPAASSLRTRSLPPQGCGGPPEWLTVRACAGLNGVGRRAVSDKIAQGTLDAVRQPDGTWLIRRVAALAYHERRAGRPRGVVGTRDVAERYGLTQTAVAYNVRHGYLPAARHDDGSLVIPFQIREEDAAEWAQWRAGRKREAQPVTVSCVVCGKTRARPRSAVEEVRRPHCSRACYHADPDRSGARARLLEQAGACGSPTCRDKECAIPPGRCHRDGCDRSATVAPFTSSPIRWVAAQPTLYCSQRCAVLDRNAGAPWGDAFAELKASAGLLDVDEVAAEVHRVRHGVMAWARRLGVGEQVFDFGKQGSWLFTPEDVDAIRGAINDDPISGRYDQDPRFNARWYLARHHSTKRYGQLAPQLAKASGKRPGPRRQVSSEEWTKILELKSEHPDWPQQRIANAVGVTRKQVRGVLAAHGSA